jgi:hypothetical protein
VLLPPSDDLKALVPEEALDVGPILDPAVRDAAHHLVVDDLAVVQRPGSRRAREVHVVRQMKVPLANWILAVHEPVSLDGDLAPAVEVILVSRRRDVQALPRR